MTLRAQHGHARTAGYGTTLLLKSTQYSIYALSRHDLMGHGTIYTYDSSHNSISDLDDRTLDASEAEMCSLMPGNWLVSNSGLRS